MKPRTLRAPEIKKFRAKIYRYYRTAGRDLPWRRTADPYHILVSEIMLQQTQVGRVIEKYHEFLKKFPTVGKLARASLGDILQVWQGLGYNRRALYLKRAAEMIVSQYRGKVPSELEVLRQLPGVGPYTAAAIAAFAANEPTVCIETNIRAVFIHFFFGTRHSVADRELLPLIEQAVDYRQPRIWYWALMDYGAMLKREVGSMAARSRHYVQQSRFEDSNRQVRGKILKVIIGRGPQSLAYLSAALDVDMPRVRKNAETMVREGILEKHGTRYKIRT